MAENEIKSINGRKVCDQTARQDIINLQPKTDETLVTTNKEITGAINELNTKVNQLGGSSISVIEPADDDLPKVFFTGTALPTTKNDVNLEMDYISNTLQFHSYIKLKCQGTSSMTYAKKNFTLTMYEDPDRTIKLKKDFKGWGNQSKFCLKANWIDSTHTRNLSGARVAYDMVESRPDSAFKQELQKCPRNGVVDGFPIKLYFNGELWGLYTFNIPKDGWMFNMDSNNPNHMVLCAEQNNDGTKTNDNVLRCEFRKEWDGSDGSSWSIEFGTYSDTLKNSFNRCVNFVMTASDEEFKANIGQYFDLYSLLDYYCFSYFTAHIDGLAKNMLMLTYDGVIWGASLYDMDSIYGADWNGASFKVANIQCPEQYQETNSLLWQRIEQCFATELYARYIELRQGALSLSNIVQHVEEIYDAIPDRVFNQEAEKWTNIPSKSTNTIKRFRDYMRDRSTYVDAQMEEIGNPPVDTPCTSISLNKTELTLGVFEGEGETKLTEQLVATVEPSNTTDVVTWSSNTPSIATVNNGLVTAKANGSAVITATCGAQTATCDVTVSGITESSVSSIYELPQETVFNGTSDYIDTGIPLMDKANVNKDWTILLDFTLSSRPKTTTSIFHCITEATGYPGISLDTNGDYFRAVLPNNNTNNIYALTTNRTQFVITKSGNTFTVYNSDMSSLATKTTTSITTTDKTLLLGANQDVDGTKGRFMNGTIHRFKLIEGIMSTKYCLDWLSINKSEPPSSNTAVFRVDATCLNTETNTLIDNIAGLNATLTGTPTLSDNNIVFTTSDAFSFDISSLNLNNKDITIRIKFTPTTLDTTTRNVFTLGDGTWNNSYTNYVTDATTRMQFGTRSNSASNNAISNAIVNNFASSSGVIVDPRTINIESELILSVRAETKEIRIFLNGTLIQDGILEDIKDLTVLNNTEGNARFVGNYSLIELHDKFMNTYINLDNN